MMNLLTKMVYMCIVGSAVWSDMHKTCFAPMWEEAMLTVQTAGGDAMRVCGALC